MSINYQIQELPDAIEGEQRTYPRPLTYNQFGHKKMASRIAMESGVQQGAVEAVLTGLPEAIKNILLEGHTYIFRSKPVQFSGAAVSSLKG